MLLPILIVVSGPPGAGKTTLAHAIARGVGCPAICRDEIKEGMVHCHPGFTPSPGDTLTQRTFTTFFNVLELLLRAGVTVVAEAAFQDYLWRPGLERLAEFGDIRIVQCTVDLAVARARKAQRDTQSPIRRAAHVASTQPAPTPFDPISLGVPTIRVDTSNGYDPCLPDMIAFLRHR